MNYTIRIKRQEMCIRDSPYPDEVIDRLARAFYPAILACWNSEEGQREFAAWQAEQAHIATKEKQEVPACWVSVKQFSKNDTATACQDWLRSTRLGRGSIKSHVRTVKAVSYTHLAEPGRQHPHQPVVPADHRLCRAGTDGIRRSSPASFCSMVPQCRHLCRTAGQLGAGCKVWLQRRQPQPQRYRQHYRVQGRKTVSDVYKRQRDQRIAGRFF